MHLSIWDTNDCDVDAHLRTAVGNAAPRQTGQELQGILLWESTVQMMMQCNCAQSTASCTRTPVLSCMQALQCNGALTTACVHAALALPASYSASSTACSRLSGKATRHRRGGEPRSRVPQSARVRGRWRCDRPLFHSSRAAAAACV